MTTRDFLPDWVQTTNRAEQDTAHIARRPPRHSRLSRVLPRTDGEGTTTTTTTTTGTTPPRQQRATSVVRPAPTPNPALAEALQKLKEDARRRQQPVEPVVELPRAVPVVCESSDPEVVVANLIGRGLEPLDPDVPILRDASLKRAVPSAFKSTSPREPPKRRRRPRTARYNDPTPTILDSDSKSGDDDDGRERSPSPLQNRKKMFRKVTALAQVDPIPLIGASVAEVEVEQEEQQDQEQEEAADQMQERLEVVKFSLDPAPDLSPLVNDNDDDQVRDEPPEKRVEIEHFYRFEPLHVSSSHSGGSLPSTPSPPSSPVGRVATLPFVAMSVAHRSTSTLASLPNMEPTQPSLVEEVAADEDPFPRFDPNFLLPDFLP
jgi:hypothetical protein